MTFSEYQKLFDTILAGETIEKPYDDSHFVEYVKLNLSRQNRWVKKGEIAEEIKLTVQSITEKQTWIVITEPWCGDAAHNVPFLAKLAELNPNITLKFQLRDNENSEIESYLTNGGKSIPKLIARNEAGADIFTWGPRPAESQVIFDQLKAENASFELQKIALQEWYNKNAGCAIQEEILAILKSI